MKKIWIINHYANKAYFNRNGRHYWMSKRLKELGYDVTIICSNIEHNGSGKVVTNSYTKKIIDEIPIIFISSSPYKSNGRDRVMNMFSFYKNLLKYAKRFEKPDLIMASSVHLLTLYGGYKLSKYFKIPLISEIRDLWPESLIAYGSIKDNSLLAKILYKMEKNIYIKSDSVIMTWEGGKAYIRDKGWISKIDVEKFYFVTNGIDLDTFTKNKNLYEGETHIEFDDNKFNIVYTGAIRTVNNLGLIVKVANELRDYQNIHFHIIGDGNERKKLEEKIFQENLTNISMWGKIPKNHVASVITKSNLNLLHNKSTILDKYGQSQNKLFEYLAAGKPILQTYTNKYSILEKHNAGILCSNQDVSEIKENILRVYSDEKLRETLSKNALLASNYYDFKVHAKNVDQIIKKLN